MLVLLLLVLGCREHTQLRAMLLQRAGVGGRAVASVATHTNAVATAAYSSSRCGVSSAYGPGMCVELAAGLRLGTSKRAGERVALVNSSAHNSTSSLEVCCSLCCFGNVVDYDYCVELRVFGKKKTTKRELFGVQQRLNPAQILSQT